MDYYNNYYEELYHAGLFSALRGRIRDGHKWLTRTGTPGHYVYTYAKKIGQSAGRLFGSRKASNNTSERKWYRTSESGPRSRANTARNTAEKEKREDRFADKTSVALAKRASKPDQNGYFNKDAKPTYNSKTDTLEFNSPNGRTRSAVKSVSYQNYTYPDGVGDTAKKIRRYDDGTRKTVNNSSVSNFSESDIPRRKKSTADRIKEWGANTLSSIRKTASNTVDSVKDWANDQLKKARGASWNNVDVKNGQTGLTGSKPKGWDEYYNRNNRTSRTTYNEYSDARRKKAGVEAAKNHRNSVVSAQKGTLAGWVPSESGRVVSTTTDKKGTVTKKFGDGNVLEYDSNPVTVSNMDEWRKKYYEPAMSGTNSNKKRRRTR